MAVPDDGLDELEPVMTIVVGEIAYETGEVSKKFQTYFFVGSFFGSTYSVLVGP